MPDWFWYIVSPLVLLGYGYYLWQQRRKRREEYSAFATRLGWNYTVKDRSLIGRYRDDPFDRGNWRRAEHVFRGKHGEHPLIAFDYSFRLEETDRTGEARTTRHHYQVVALGIGESKPFLEVAPHGFFSRMAHSPGWPSLETGDEEFDKTIEVTTEDQDFATALLTDDIRKWLLAHARNDGTPIRVVADEVITWRPGSLDVHELSHRVDFLCDLLGKTNHLRPAVS